jgi:hypothetical protein
MASSPEGVQMSNAQLPPEPREFKAWLFYHGLALLNALVPRPVRSFTRLLLFEVSPDVPVSLTSAWKDASLSAVFTVAASLTFIMCFVVVLVWSAAVGTLSGNDPSRLYLIEDWVNLLNYSLLCPLYIGFGAVLIALTIRGNAELKQLTSANGPTDRLIGGYSSAFLFLLAVFVIALFVSAQFMAENMNPSIYPRIYWFMDTGGPNGSRVMGAFGFYYGLLNFCLLLFTLLTVGAFLSEFRLLIQVAESLDRVKADQSITTEMLRTRLTTFTQVYLAGKIAVASYMANALVWKTSQTHHSTNLLVLGGALTLFGVGFLSIPRYYIELQWFRLNRIGTSAATAVEYEDLRPWEVNFVGGSWKPRIVAGVIDTVIIGGFISSFWL